MGSAPWPNRSAARSTSTSWRSRKPWVGSRRPRGSASPRTGQVPPRAARPGRAPRHRVPSPHRAYRSRGRWPRQGIAPLGQPAVSVAAGPALRPGRPHPGHRVERAAAERIDVDTALDESALAEGVRVGSAASPADGTADGAHAAPTPPTTGPGSPTRSPSTATSPRGGRRGSAANCPFDALAREHTALVCRLNRASSRASPTASAAMARRPG